MQSLSHFTSFFQGSNFGPAAILVVAILTTYLFARGPRAPTESRLTAASAKSWVTVRVIRWVVIGIAALGVLLAMGIDLKGLLSLLGAVLSLLAIGFVAMWSILSHMLASVLIVAFRPFEMNDQIEIVGDDPILGKVVELSLIYTTLRTSDGGLLRIPNNLFFQRVLKRHAPSTPAKENLLPA
ncbi:mechanosensitive ion channel family protein [Rariglobus hedericola]|uniref:Mechanosensitive ion channel n=1 Tax=Rariglobus hedericola TaxID=2597822 RepID=A0A556QM58_9BACT|nr:mechanosensitive ion channel domain-containing protein [Rariglobus hedericola]TSJ77738.1 mechanosensitive ion channel [Rariglobus hedericola]